MKLLAGMFGRLRASREALPAANARPAPPSREALARREREKEAGRLAAVVQARERAQAEADAARARESAEAIAQACRVQGFWWPRAPVPESRLGGRLSWGERVIEAIKEVWR